MTMASRQDLEALMRLDGKVALITGGGGVLGAAMGKGLGLAGAKVALCDLAADKAADAAAQLAELEIVARGAAMDAFDKESIERALADIEAELGPVDILVNAAGGNVGEATVSPEQTFFDLPGEALSKVVGLNLLAGAVYPSQVIGRRMAERNKPASIINVSSMNAFRPLTRIVGYSAAKAAVSNFTQWLAVYMARELESSVRVNALAPGFFLTEQNRYLLTEEDGSLTERGQTIIGHTPMGRFGEPDDLIGATVWLASEASAFVTGIVLPLDGGFSAFSGV
ncbi:SDR family oxidoreductase [Candidatus Sumerlaeota bacterium]